MSHIPSHEEDEIADQSASAYRSLWAAVLWTQVNDLLAPRHSNGKLRRETEAAISWLGSHPRKDLALICSLAGCDVSATHRRLLALAAMSDAEKRVVRLRTTKDRGATSEAA